MEGAVGGGKLSHSRVLGRRYEVLSAYTEHHACKYLTMANQGCVIKTGTFCVLLKKSLLTPRFWPLEW